MINPIEILTQASYSSVQCKSKLVRVHFTWKQRFLAQQQLAAQLILIPKVASNSLHSLMIIPSSTLSPSPLHCNRLQPVPLFPYRSSHVPGRKREERERELFFSISKLLFVNSVYCILLSGAHMKAFQSEIGVIRIRLGLVTSPIKLFLKTMIQWSQIFSILQL